MNSATPPLQPAKRSKTKKIVLIVILCIVGVLLLLGTLGACIDANTSDEEKAEQQAQSEQKKADKEAEKAEKQRQKDEEKAQKDAEKQAEKDRKDAEKRATDLDDDQMKDSFESWFLGRFGAASWSDLADQDQTGSMVWARHIVSVAYSDHALTIVTNFDPDNPAGKQLAENMAAQIKNGTEIAHDNGELPLPLEKNLEFLNVFSLDGKVIAKADKGFQFD